MHGDGFQTHGNDPNEMMMAGLLKHGANLKEGRSQHDISNTGYGNEGGARSSNTRHKQRESRYDKQDKRSQRSSRSRGKKKSHKAERDGF